MLIGYERVSTDDQNLALQHDALQVAGCDKIFSDKMSGVKADRPGLQQALNYVRPGDTLVVWRLDRLGRSLKDLIALVEDLERRQIGFRSLQESIDTTTSGGKLIFHVFGALAEFERNLIRERTQAGLQAARARGRTGGRRQKLTPEQIAIGRSLASDPNRTVTSICEHLEISRPTFYRYISPKGELAPTTKTTQVHLWLRVENNNKFVRRKHKVRETIERMCLSRYGMQKQHKDSWEYELTIVYQDDQDLDKQIENLLDEMHCQADLEDCFIEADMTEMGTERSW
ncbi:MAG: resolvase [Leptolyngbya sp.]|nr:MAG: resolvase [Leptolyngbya sp.]